MSLTFARTVCSRCDAHRQTRFPCPVCGLRPRPTEVDVDVQFRHRSVEPAQRARESLGQSLDMDAMELLTSGHLGELADRIFAAGDLIGRGDESGADQLADLAGEIASLERWTREVKSLRPLLFVADAVKVIVDELINVFDVVVRALLSEEISAAQACEAEVQACLDRSAGAIERANERMDIMLSVIGGEDPIGAWMAVAFDGDPITAIERGEATFLQRTGLGCGAATSLAAVTMAPMIATICDEDRWWSLVNEHVRFLDHYRTLLGPVLQEPSFASRRRDVIHDLWLSARRASRMPDPETLRQDASDLLDTGHLVVEQQLKFNLGLGCALTTRRSFAATQGCDVSELAGIARGQGWPIAQQLGDAAIRNAFAHRDFTIDGDCVLLSPRRGRPATSPRSLTIPELQDAVLEIIEISSAMELATLWLTEQVDPNSVIIPEGLVFLESTLIGFGWNEVEIAAEVDDCVRISGCVDTPVPLAAIAFAVGPLVGTVREVWLHLKSRDRSRECTAVVPVDLYAAWGRTECEPEKEAAFIRLCEATTVDGSPIMSRSHVHHVIAIRACQLTIDQEQQLATVCTGLKVWRSLARALELPDLAREIGRAIRLRTYRAAEIPVSEADTPALLEHVGTDLPPLRANLLS